METVSIIIPVYNVQEYLTECIDSALEQTYKEIEIILIDDGSTDDSGRICDLYAGRNSKIHVIHQKNEGLSAARNKGIDACSGKYIYFLDSDDFISPDTIQTLVNLSEVNNADIAITEYEMFEKDVSNILLNQESVLVMDAKQAIKTMLYPGMYDHCACAKLYSAKLWNDIRFPIGKKYEDLYVVYDIFYRASKVVYYSVPKYYYRVRGKSIMNSEINDQDIELLDISDIVAGKLQSWYPDFAEIIRNKQVQTYANFLARVMKSRESRYKPVQKRIVKKCRENVWVCIKSKHMKINDKIKIIIICICRPLYLFAYKIGKCLNRIKYMKRGIK